MKKGALCASVLTGALLLLALLPGGSGSRAAQNDDAYFVNEEISDQAVKGEDSASNDYLQVRVAMEVNTSGFYNLTAELSYQGKGISMLSNSSYLTPGLRYITLRFSNRDIYLSHAVGNYMATLSLRTPGFPAQPVVNGSYTTAFYHYADFNPDSFEPYTSDEEYRYSDNPSNLTIRNEFITFVFDKGSATMTYYFTHDEQAGRHGRFQVAFERVLGYQTGPTGWFNTSDAISTANFSKASWKESLLDNGTHPKYGSFVRFNISYTMDLVESRLQQVVAGVEVTFSFYFTANPHPTRDRLLTVPRSTQAELDISMSLTNTISGSGLVLEQTLRDSTRNHDFLVRDAIGDFRLAQDTERSRVAPLTPRDPQSIPKISFLNRWDGFSYGIFSWNTPASSRFDNSSQQTNILTSFTADRGELVLYQAFPAKGAFLSFDGIDLFGLEGTTPPGPAPPPVRPERHDPLLYVLGSFLALAIIFLTMRVRTRSFVREEEEIEALEELELSEAESDQGPLSIEEKAIGEEEAWRRRFDESSTAAAAQEKDERDAKEAAGKQKGDGETAKEAAVGQKGSGYTEAEKGPTDKGPGGKDAARKEVKE